MQDPLHILDAIIDIHLHLTACTQKKDGPSAGVAIVYSPLFLPQWVGFNAKMMALGLVPIFAIISLLTWKCVPSTAVMWLGVQKNHYLFPLLLLWHEFHPSQMICSKLRQGLSRNRGKFCRCTAPAGAEIGAMGMVGCKGMVGSVSDCFIDWHPKKCLRASGCLTYTHVCTVYQFWSTSYDFRLIWKPRYYSITYIIFRLLSNLFNFWQANLFKTSKHWNSFLTHCIW